jgi:glycosidase
MSRPTAPASIADLDFSPRQDVFPSPLDWRDQVFYQILIDRFDNNAEDLRPYDPDTAPRGRDVAEGSRFQGGNLKGITRRLDYIRELGCTAVWISPPFKQRQDDPGSYHGYAIQDFLDIDPRFGTAEDLRDLVRKAHARGMYVILDIVINHTADIFRYTEEQTPYRPEGQYEFKEWHKVSQSKTLTRDDAVWPVELQDPDCFKRKGSIRDLMAADEQESVDGDFFNLKELNTANPAVLNVLVSAYKYWIALADVDGYRIDTVRNVEPHFCAKFVNAIREYTTRIGKHGFLFFGEIVGDDDLLHKYVGNNGPALGTEEWYPLLDAVLDFPLYGVLDEVLKGKKNSGELQTRYERFRHHYRNLSEAAKYYVTFVDNHDQTHRPWYRFMNGVRDPQLAVLAMGFLLTNLGMPCIYYGTEQGFDGGGDSDVHIRETMFGGKWGAFNSTGMHFFNPQHAIYRGIAAIAKIRAAEPALRYGRQYFRNISADGNAFGAPMDGKCTLAYSRVLDSDEMLVAMNLDENARRDYIQVDAGLTGPGAKLKDLLTGEILTVEQTPDGSSAVRLPLDPHQFRVLKHVF